MSVEGINGYLAGKKWFMLHVYIKLIQANHWRDDDEYVMHKSCHTINFFGINYLGLGLDSTAACELLYFPPTLTMYFREAPFWNGSTYGSISRGRGKWWKGGIFQFFLELCCDQTVWFFECFSTVVKKFWPLHSKNVFVLVLAHLAYDYFIGHALRKMLHICQW